MTDSIERQAAIEEWKNDFKGYVNALNIPRDDYNGIMEYIDELPSAQPDRSCIEQIKWERDTAIQQLNELGYSFGEAIRHDKDAISRKGAINAVCTVLYPDADKMNDAKKVLKEMPSAQSEQRWIPCSEKLPDNVSEVLVSCKGKIKLVFFYEGSDGLHVWDDYEECLNEEPDAWMPLPEPYQGES